MWFRSQGRRARARACGAGSLRDRCCIPFFLEDSPSLTWAPEFRTPLSANAASQSRMLPRYVSSEYPDYPTFSGKSEIPRSARYLPICDRSPSEPATSAGPPGRRISKPTALAENASPPIHLPPPLEMSPGSRNPDVRISPLSQIRLSALHRPLWFAGCPSNPGPGRPAVTPGFRPYFRPKLPWNQPTGTRFREIV